MNRDCALDQGQLPYHPDDLAIADLVLESMRQLATETDPARLSFAIEPLVTEIAFADSAYLVIPEIDTLHGRPVGPSAGLIATVLADGSPVCLDRADTDPNFDPNAEDLLTDTSRGKPGTRRIMVIPVPGQLQAVLGAIVVLRQSHRQAWSTRDQRVMELLANELMRPLEQILRERLLRRVLGHTPSQPSGLHAGASDLFRPEALEAHLQGARDSGSPLRLMPAWTRAAYVLLLLAVVTFSAAAALVHVDRWASAPAVLRSTGPSRAKIVALFPAKNHSDLAKGQTLIVRFESGETVNLRINAIEASLVARDTAAHRLGDSLQPLDDDRLSWVEAQLPVSAVELVDGSRGQARVRLDSESLWTALRRGAGHD